VWGNEKRMKREVGEKGKTKEERRAERTKGGKEGKGKKKETRKSGGDSFSFPI